MPYSYPNNIPQFAKKQTADVQKVTVRVFNETYNKTQSEQKARQAALAAMKNAREAKKTEKTAMLKSSDALLKQGLYVVLVPDEVDAHGDLYDKITVNKACENFNKSNARANLFHMLDTDSFSIIESYIAPVDMQFQEEVVKAGTWLVKLQFSDELFEGVVNGLYSGVSIGAMALTEKIDTE